MSSIKQLSEEIKLYEKKLEVLKDQYRHEAAGNSREIHETERKLWITRHKLQHILNKL